VSDDYAACFVILFSDDGVANSEYNNKSHGRKKKEGAHDKQSVSVYDNASSTKQKPSPSRRKATQETNASS